MYQVGVTGGIGSGKSLVCEILEKLGVPVYNADREAKRLMNTHPVLVSGVKRLLGEEAYRGDELDRAYVAGRVFGDRIMLEGLNKLVHPVVREDYRRWTEQHAGAAYVVEEAAVLFESGASRFMDLSVLVYAPAELRIHRVMDRDGVSREEIQRRMSHQMDEEEKRTLADEVLVNDERSMLLPQVVELHERIIKRE